MEKLGLIGLLSMIVLLSGCSAGAQEVKKEINNLSDVGNGTVHLLTPTIAPEDNTLEFMVTDFDEGKTIRKLMKNHLNLRCSNRFDIQ
ncbi:hypothetical protein [Enterococcus sp. AZ109]|uniref:hypothetical protein n=1 Tax=Enterococcus sp. AZ109 TaxID=2774634 RepID=UPI003F29505E